jgi:signal transduction histidine kinase
MTRPSRLDSRVLFGTFLAVAVTFAVANAYGQYAMARIDSASDEIAYDSAPSIEHLAGLRAAVRHVEFLLERGARTGDAARDEVERALSEVHANTRAYLVFPKFPGELKAWEDVERGLDDFEAAVHRTLAHRAAGAGALAQASLAEVASAADRITDAAARDIELNAEAGRDLALRIKAVRHSAAWAAWVLTASCVAFTLVAGLLVLRQVRRHQDLVDRHAALQEQRASELEIFAGRAAHDILNPVAATQMALQLAVQSPPGEAQERRFMERALRNVLRVRTIVDGLLQFARAGASPPPGARAAVAAVVEDVVAGARPAAEGAGFEVDVRPLPPASVACSPGVLTSLVSNLLHNAIKHAGGAGGGTITVRADAREGLVRVEVEDTGPGIPPDALKDIFLPYVRGPKAGQGGLGLGLATVRRLAESHGGRAGVRSVLGEGSLFWFELPEADAAVPQARPAEGGARATTSLH